jgi:hypothetical protein
LVQAVPSARGGRGSRFLSAGPQQEAVVRFQRLKLLPQHLIVRMQHFKLLHQRILVPGSIVQTSFQLFFRLRQLVVLHLRHKILRQLLARLDGNHIRLGIIHALFLQ